MKQFKGMAKNWKTALKNAGYSKMRKQDISSDFSRYTRFDYDNAIMFYLDVDCFGRFCLMEQNAPNAKLSIIGTERSEELDSDTTYKGKEYNNILNLLYEPA